MLFIMNLNFVNIQYEFGEEGVLKGAGLFSLQTKLNQNSEHNVLSCTQNAAGLQYAIIIVSSHVKQDNTSK